jgi:superfamily I DNA/RNA helicase/RecB family exonuclease
MPWVPLGDSPPFAPDPEQASVLDHDRGLLLVLGGPGTGKTAVLRERVARLLEAGTDPARVVLFVLSRRAAREAKEWLVRRLRRSVPELPVHTVHGFAFRTLGRRFGELDYSAPPQVLSAPEQYGLVRELLLGEDVADWPHFGRLLRVPAFAREVADFLLRAQERLLDPEELEERVERAGRAEYREVAGFYRRYLDALSQAGQVDFSGLLFQTVTLLRRDPGQPVEHVLVDDYQDATPAGEAILSALAGTARSAVVAADPHGHVFSYRGGSLEPLSRLPSALPGVRTVRLRTGHRLGAALALVERLDRPEPTGPEGAEGAGPPAAVHPGPDLRAFVVANPGEEADAAAHHLLSFRVDEDVPWGRMAVILRRYGAYLTALRHALSRHGIPFVVVAQASELAAEPAARLLLDVFRFALRPERREDLLEPLLASPVGGLDPHALRRLRRAARTAGTSLLDLVLRPEGSPELPADLDAAVRRLRDLAVELPELSRTRGPDEVFFELWRRLPHFAELVARRGPRADRDLEALAALSEVLIRFAERRPGATLQDYLEALEAAEFTPDPWLPPEERYPDAVRVVSAHRAQGVEFEAAVVVGCLEGEFPLLSAPEPMLSLAAALEPRSARERLADRLAEERALFRLAVSRARRGTVLLASRSTGERTPRTPSRFATRLGLTWEPPGDPHPPATSLRAMEAALRRRLADPSGDPADRLAAAAALPLVGARPETWWGRREWTDPGTPLFEGEIRTSYSRLSVIDNCALQYLYDVEMGLDPEATFQMWLGSLVHAVIDRVQRGELPRDEAVLHRELDRSWRSDVFPNRAIEHRRYLDAQDMLSRWIHHETDRIVRSEVWFEFPIDGAVVRGRIDAIFRQENGHLRVVDYKTGRTAPTAEETKRDLQLAAYYLALLRTPELAQLGRPGLLELAYLALPHRDRGFVRRQVAPNTIADYEAAAEGRILELLARVRAESFAPSPDADCQFCAYRTICPRWPEGADVPIGPSPAPLAGSPGGASSREVGR